MVDELRADHDSSVHIVVFVTHQSYLSDDVSVDIDDGEAIFDVYTLHNSGQLLK